MKEYTFEEILLKDGFLAYTCTGYSMMPLLRPGRDVVVIKKKDSSRCKRLDVVLYRRGDMYVIHRVLRVLPKGYVIVGDHNAFLEYDIKDKDILGVMVKFIRHGKSITTDNIVYKAYSHLWCDLYPLRVVILRIKGHLRDLIVKVISGLCHA